MSTENLTYHNTPCTITPYRKSGRGRENPFSIGDNTPQLKAVFFCLSFYAHGRIHIMMVLFGQSLWLVAPMRGILTPSNTVTSIVRNICDGFTTLSIGITA